MAPLSPQQTGPLAKMADGTDGGAILQVVSGDGSFNTSGVEQFVKATGVETAGVGYSIVAIMGPQSSGKSTLLNHLVRRGRLGVAQTCRQRRVPTAGTLPAGVLSCFFSLRCLVQELLLPCAYTWVCKE